jgi:hypothetical protein
MDPTERICFIEQTGVLIRWLLTAAFLIIQLTSPIVSDRIFYIGFPLAVLYNLTVQLLLKYRCDIHTVSYITTSMDILISLVLIYLAAGTDIYLWYFVLLVSHSARFGFIGAFGSPILFSASYTGIILLRGVPLSLQTLMMRALFFVITGVVSGYLARKEHLEFDRILRPRMRKTEGPYRFGTSARWC